MKYKINLSWVAVGIMALSTACNSRSNASKSSSIDSEKSKPNVVVLFSDDAGYADFSFQGSKTHYTPHIDQLANEGIQFSNAYVSASVCSPSRAGLITGRYQNRFGHYNNLPGDEANGIPMSERGLPSSELTIADLMKQSGYVTGMVGKWHLGEEEAFHPCNRGFDSFLGMMGGGSPYHAGKANKIVRNFEPADYRSLPYLTDAFGDEACSFIEKNKEQPFLLYLSFNAPHTPLHARPDYLEEARGQFKTEQRAINAAMTRSLDDNVGKVMAKLKELGLENNTIVVFTNDNGGAMPYNASLNSPLRGTKGTLLEGGIRVPFVMKWPAMLSAGTVYEQPVITLDILPSVVKAAGGKLPNDRVMDGVDLIPFITGKKSGSPHEYLCWNFQWAKAVRQGNWKYLVTPGNEVCLYNLAEDISEQVNLATEYPEKVKELQLTFEEWNSVMMAPLWVISDQWKKHATSRYNQDIVNGFIKE